MTETNKAISLAQIKTGRVELPHFVMVYGVDGVGKTTFGAEAPNAVFIGSEVGFGQLSVARFPAPQSFADVLATCQLLFNEKHDYKTLVLDSLDWLEPLVFKSVCAKQGWKNIEDAGFGKGYAFLIPEWLELINILKKLRTKMNVVLIAHASVRKFADPEANETYDRYQLKLFSSEKVDTAALWREAVDNVLFANYETTVKLKKGDRKAKAYGDGSRVMYTERRPAFDAKNRFSLPFELPFSWADYVAACSAGEPGNSDDKIDLEKLLEIAKGQEEAAVTFLRSKKLLAADQDLKDLDAKQRTRILNNPEGFLKAIQPETTE